MIVDLLNNPGYLPKDQRKKILLLSDDPRLPSGVGSQALALITNTCHHFNLVSVASGVNHPEHGKIFDAGESLNAETNLSDAFLRMYPYNGYGDAQLIRNLIQFEKPDAIMAFTDPRYFIWLFQMEHEIRQQIPIIYWNIWDSYPPPFYNKPYYKSCDALFAISKQTYNLNKVVLGPEESKKRMIKYLPHGINKNIYHKIDENDTESNKKMLAEMKQYLFKGDTPNFVLLFDSRNIHRKKPSDVIMAFREFYLTLNKAEQEGVRLVMHTTSKDEAGFDLIYVLKNYAPEVKDKVIFSETRLDLFHMNALYNCSDVVISCSNAEGYGCNLNQSNLSERLICAVVGGGMTDQMGFKDDHGNYLHEDIHYNDNWFNNCEGPYYEHDEFSFPVFPAALNLNGSLITPALWDYNINIHDVVKQIKNMYNLSNEERLRRGKLAREFAIKQGMTDDQVGSKFIEYTDELLSTWSPREKYSFIKI